MNKVMKYTKEKSQLILLSLLKSYGIKKVVASAGTTNFTLVMSMQNDPWFEMYSSVDERSAAYMACGLAYESGEPVVITCTEATASRNYMPGLTEAYYRKLPVLAITGTHGFNLAYHRGPQSIDRM
jgi:2-succinyl-5-enolpyruvyl-6-hydroxy-3-cyclohexene-1-carboxylate synthase